MLNHGQHDNLSFFAFTATPKQQTLMLFGEKGADGRPRPFHTYSMRQAIEEGFILDVLLHYTTYRNFYKLAKSIADNPEMPTSPAMKAARRFEELAAKPGSELTALAEADVAFHDAIFNGTKNLRLIQILGNLREQMYRFRIEYMKDEAVRKELVEEHRQIRSAIREKNCALAVEKISEHIDNQRQAIFRSLED